MIAESQMHPQGSSPPVGRARKVAAYLMLFAFVVFCAYLLQRFMTFLETNTFRSESKRLFKEMRKSHTGCFEGGECNIEQFVSDNMLYSVVCAKGKVIKGKHVFHYKVTNDKGFGQSEPSAETILPTLPKDFLSVCQAGFVVVAYSFKGLKDVWLVGQHGEYLIELPKGL